MEIIFFFNFTTCSVLSCILNQRGHRERESSPRALPTAPSGYAFASCVGSRCAPVTASASVSAACALGAPPIRTTPPPTILLLVSRHNHHHHIFVPTTTDFYYLRALRRRRCIFVSTFRTCTLSHYYTIYVCVETIY